MKGAPGLAEPGEEARESGADGGFWHSDASFGGVCAPETVGSHGISAAQDAAPDLDVLCDTMAYRDSRQIDTARHANGFAHMLADPEPAVRAGTREPLRVVHVVTRLLRAGSEENVIATCLGQAEKGHEVTLVYGRDHDPGYETRLGSRIRMEPIDSLVHPIDPRADIRASRDMTRLFRRIAPDIVHTHQSKAGVVGRISARLAHVPHVVHGVHIAPFVNVGRSKRAAYIALERMMAPLTDAFISVSGGMRDTYLKAGIGPCEAHHVVYSGMQLDAFIHAAPPDDWRALLGIAPDAPKPPVVLMLAALEPRKRHRALIEVFGAVVERFPEVRLLCAGEGPARDEVEKAIAASGLQKNIRLLGFHSEPGRLVALADLCLLTSMREGLPRVVVQYLAGGKPAITSRLPGIEEIVAHGVSGLITDPDDLSDTTRAIIEVLSNDVLRARLGSGAAATDVTPWQPASLVEGTEQVYARLVSRARNSGLNLSPEPQS